MPRDNRLVNAFVVGISEEHSLFMPICPQISNDALGILHAIECTLLVVVFGDFAVLISFQG